MEEIYNINTESFSGIEGFEIIPIVFFVGLLVRNSLKKRFKYFFDFSWVFLFFILMTASYFQIKFYINFKEAKKKYNTGSFKTVKGKVKKFKTVDYRLRGTESFLVDGIKFEYKARDYIPGYNKTTAEGGAISNNIILEIDYFGSSIYRIVLHAN